MTAFEIDEAARFHGHGWAELFSADGARIARVPFENKITEYGDQLYGDRGAGIGSHAAPTGMQLGTGTTTASKTGAGAAIVTYLAGTSVAFSVTPASSLVSGIRQIQYKCVWGAGVGTHGALTEVSLINQAIAADSAAPAGNTISRAKFASSLDKAAGSFLIVTWNHLLGTL